MASVAAEAPETDSLAAAAAAAAEAAEEMEMEAFRVPRGLWCYRVDRDRAVLGGALTDGGSVFEWLRGALALAPGVDTEGVMREVEVMPPASHGMVVS